MKKAISFITLVCLCLSLCGCWDYEEIKKLTMVSGIGIDYIDENYLITAEIASMQQEGETVRDAAKPKIIKSKGKTPSSALQNLNAKNGGALFLKGCTLCIISDSIAKDGIYKIARFVLTNPDLPQTMEFIISEGDAREIFKASPETNQLLCQELTNSVSEDQQNTATAISCNACEIYNSEKLYITRVKKQGKKAKLNGIYYFDNDKIKNSASLLKAPYILLMEGSSKASVLSLSDVGDFYVSSCLKTEDEKGVVLNIEGSLFLKDENMHLSKSKVKDILTANFKNVSKEVLQKDEKIRLNITYKTQNLITEG